MARSKRYVRGIQIKYLKRLERTGLIGDARACAGIGTKALARWRTKPWFERRENEAKMTNLEKREKQVDKRAFEGVREPIYHDGDRVGWRRKYSDTLAMFRLRALDPDKYSERKQVAHTHSGSVTVYLPDNHRQKPALLNPDGPDRGIEVGD